MSKKNLAIYLFIFLASFLVIYFLFIKKIYFALIILISLIVLFILFNKNYKQYLLIFFITTLCTFYLYEIYAIYKLYLMKPFNSDLNNYDNRNKFELYKNLKQKNENVALVIPPSILSNDKENIFHFSGISSSKTIHCNENGYYALFDSDKYGFNNPQKRWEVEEIDYLLVGDSFTLGACVNRPYDIASQLELKNLSVLNLGYTATGPLSQYAVLREYLSYKIKNVIWIYFEGNDLEDLSRELKNIILVKYLNNIDFTQDIQNKQKEINHLLKLKIKEEEKLFLKNNSIFARIINFIKLINTRNRINNIYQLNKANEIYNPYTELRKIFKLANDLVSLNNSRLHIVYISSFANSTKNNYNDSQYKNVKQIVSDLNISFIDTYEEVFKNEPNPLSLFPFEKKGHYNEKGYLKVSQTIFNLLKNKN